MTVPANKAAAYHMVTSTLQGGQHAPTALFNSSQTSKLHTHKVLTLANGPALFWLLLKASLLPYCVHPCYFNRTGASNKEDTGGGYLPVTNHHYVDESMRRPSTSGTHWVFYCQNRTIRNTSSIFSWYFIGKQHCQDNEEKQRADVETGLQLQQRPKRRCCGRLHQLGRP